MNIEAGQVYADPNGTQVHIDSQCYPSIGEVWGGTRTNPDSTLDLVVITEQGLADGNFVLQPAG